MISLRVGLLLLLLSTPVLAQSTQMFGSDDLAGSHRDGYRGRRVGEFSHPCSEEDIFYNNAVKFFRLDNRSGTPFNKR